MRLVKDGDTIIKEGDLGDEMYVVDRYQSKQSQVTPSLSLSTTAAVSFSSFLVSILPDLLLSLASDLSCPDLT
jgi:hypothetical protein